MVPPLLPSLCPPLPSQMMHYLMISRVQLIPVAYERGELDGTDKMDYLSTTLCVCYVGSFEVPLVCGLLLPVLTLRQSLSCRFSRISDVRCYLSLNGG